MPSLTTHSLAATYGGSVMEDVSEWKNVPDSEALFATLKSVPRKVRDQIYTEVLKQTDYIIIPTSFIRLAVPGLPEDVEDIQLPALLRVCKQIQHEAVSIYYGEKLFKATISDDSTWTVPFGRISSLSDEETSALKGLVLEFQLSEEGQVRYHGLLDDMRRMRAMGMPPKQAFQLFASSMKTKATTTLLQQLCFALHSAKKTDEFDLSKITFVAARRDDDIYPTNVEWTRSMQACLDAAKKGRMVDLN